MTARVQSVDGMVIASGLTEEQADLVARVVEALLDEPEPAAPVTREWTIQLSSTSPFRSPLLDPPSHPNARCTFTLIKSPPVAEAAADLLRCMADLDRMDRSISWDQMIAEVDATDETVALADLAWSEVYARLEEDQRVELWHADISDEAAALLDGGWTPPPEPSE